MPTVTIPRVPQITIDDARIEKWIGNRLNGARNRFIQNMSGMGSGKVYRRGTVYHIASNPFEYPKSDSARLAGSVHTTIDKQQGSLYSNLQYADYLESGTPRMLPRKMLGDALSEEIAERPDTDELAKAATIE